MVSQDPEKVSAARQQIRQTEAQGAWDHLVEVLCEPTRRRIAEALLTTTELSVSDLAIAVGRSVPVVSQHLRILRSLGIVQGERRANFVYYQIRPGPTVEQVRQIIRTVSAQ